MSHTLYDLIHFNNFDTRITNDMLKLLNIYFLITYRNQITCDIILLIPTLHSEMMKSNIAPYYHVGKRKSKNASKWNVKIALVGQLSFCNSKNIKNIYLYICTISKTKNAITNKSFSIMTFHIRYYLVFIIVTTKCILKVETQIISK